MPLQNAVNDARAMESVLREMGFEVESVTDASLRSMEGALDRFVGNLRAGDVALFYYSGHGIQLGGENYLVPVDYKASDEAEVRYQALPAQKVLDRMEGRGTQLNIVILDACRNNPFLRTRAASGGLAGMTAGKGSYIAFAAAPGKVAWDAGPA
ncbi:MAG: caspase family protein [Bryobacteraceae bacterium]|nr:caspase family protein [Bryobacteraceae bacterium]